MQTDAPEAFDIRKENPETLARYGDTEIGRSCLLARRLVERGVRIVQVYYGNSQPWDSHEEIMVHKRLARQTDPAVASLIEDLKDRDMLRNTLVIFGTEFGELLLSKMVRPRNFILAATTIPTGTASP